MLGLAFDAAKHFFFDSPLIESLIDQAMPRALSKAGAYVRRTAIGLIRPVGKRGKPSAPGRPPKSRTGLLREFLFFAFDPSRNSVVIGPAKTNQVHFMGAGEPVTGTVPSVLEHGGAIGVLEVWSDYLQKWTRADLRSKRRLAGRRTRIRTVTIAKRPYMQPAYDKEQAAGTFSATWQDVLSHAA
jgi:hypothetical protein